MHIDSGRVLNMYGLIFNPFGSDRPFSSIYVSKYHKRELWRLENLVMDGGIAAVIGEPGTGKSTFLRYLSDHLEKIPDAQIVHMDRPQNSLADFYRELGSIFQLELRVSNRWGGFQALREKWSKHIRSTLLRPVLLIDEAQLMQPQTLTELRLLSSERFDSRKLLTVALAGDQRLVNKLNHPELLPLKSRIKPWVECNSLSKEDLAALLRYTVDAAGNPGLVSEGLICLLAEQSCGNPRIMMQLGHDLLLAGAMQERDVLDEALYYDLFQERLGKPKPSRRLGGGE